MVLIETFAFRRTGETTESNIREDTIQNGNTKQIRMIKYKTHSSKEMPVAIPYEEELKHIHTQTKIAIYCPQGSGTLRQQLLMMHGIALYCIVLHGIAWYCMVLHGIV